MKTPPYLMPALFAIISLLLLMGSVMPGVNTYPACGYQAIPGICEVPASFMHDMINGFSVLGHAHALLQDSKKSIMPYLDDISTLLPFG